MMPAMDVAGRTARLCDLLGGAGVDALLVTSLVHIRYLTGFTGSAALLLVAADGTLTFVTDGRYAAQSADQLHAAGLAADIRIGRTSAEQRDVVRDVARALARIGLEADWVTWGQQRRYAAEWFEGAELVPTEGLIESLRRTKDGGEVARIEAAARIADESLARLLPRLHDGPTEREFGLALDDEMRRSGASGPSFETIVAAGTNAAKPHHRPSDRRIAAGDVVVIDFGAVIDGYCSDMTRTVSVGEPADHTLHRMRAVVAEAQQSGVDTVSPGTAVAEVDAACRQVIGEAGWAEAFVHGTGHGVGLQIHEDPRVTSVSTATLQPGDVVTVEPGVYLPDHGGVRIEDTVVVTAGGCRPLTTAPKDFVI
jgi:Xaa-Pro aminopeptidase